MRKTPRTLVLLHRDRLFREQIAAVARLESWDLRVVGSWDELLDAVRAVPASAQVVVDPYEGSTGRAKSLAVDLAALLNRFPSLTVTAALTASAGRLDHVRRLGEWGWCR